MVLQRRLSRRFSKQMRLHLGLSLVLLAPLGACKRFAVNIGGTFVPFTTVTGSQAISPEVTKLLVDIRAGEVRVQGAGGVEGGRTEGAEPEGPGEGTGRNATATIVGKVKIKESLFNPDADRGAFADHVRVEQKGDTLVISDAHSGQPDEKNWRVSLKITIPADLSLNLGVGAGRIVVEGMQSDMTANSGAGEIILKGDAMGAVTADSAAGKVEIVANQVSGPLTANTATGGVHVTILQSPPVKDVLLSAAVGDVYLDLPDGSSGTFDLSSVVGHVSVDNHPGITVKRESVGATGKGVVGAGGPTYTLRTSTGAVRVR